MADDLTVIVVAVVGGEAFRACAEAVRVQASNLLLVSKDGKITDHAGETIGHAEHCNIPFKRKCAVELSPTPLVALIEDTVMPGPEWASAIRTALSDRTALGCGGPVSIDPGLPASSRALALSEYGKFGVRRSAGERMELPGCNFAFRRSALLEAMPAGDGLVDQTIFARLRNRGGNLLWVPGMAVTFCHANLEGARLATRFRHGRIYASSQSKGLFARTAAAGKALLLPPVLVIRNLRTSPPAERLSIATIGWLALQSTAWAAGELAGAVLGASPKGLAQWQ